jgi:hypothetical protein
MAFAALGALAGLSLIVNVAVDPAVPEATLRTPGPAMTIQEQRATMQPLIRSANECIARKVSGDPRFPDLIRTGNVNELIVESIPACLDAVRALIDEHDELYGAGTGEGFFMGPYLDALPSVVQNIVKGQPR